MRRVVLGVFAAAVAGCSPGTGTPCGSSSCNENEICDQALKLCIANLGPRVVIDAPAENALIGSATFELRGTATDDEGAPSVVEYSLAEGEWTPVTVDERGLFTVAVATPNLDGVASSVKLRATDATGNAAVASRAVRFDRVAPRCDFISPTDGRPALTGDTLVGRIEIAIEDGSPATGELLLDDVIANEEPAWEPMSVSGGLGLYLWQLLPGAGRHLYALRARARDEAGNPCEIGPISIYMDTAKPGVNVEEPDQGKICSNAACRIGLQITDTNVDPLPTVSYRIDGGAAVQVTEQPIGSLLSFDIPVPDVDFNPVTIEFIARDWAENERSATLNIVFDRRAPQISFPAPAPNTLFNKADMADAGSQVTVAWTVADDDPQLSVEKSVGRDAGGPFSATAQTQHVFTINPADNGHTYVASVRATDRGGNTATATHAFRVDVVSPTFTVSPSDGARMTERAVRLSFSEQTTFANSLAALSWDAGGPLLGNFTVLSDGGYAWLNLSPGTIYRGTLAPTGEDPAGNLIEQTKTFAFFTDPLAPDAGTVLFSDAGVISAAFDQDGVLTISDARLDSAGNVRFRWFDLNPATGAVVEKQSQLVTATAASSVRTEVSAWASIAANGATDRKSSLIQYVDALPPTGFLRTSSGYFTQHSAPAAYILPGAVFPDEPRSGPLDYGLITQPAADQIYSRPPNADVTLPYPGQITVGGELSFMVWRTRLIGTFPNVAEILERRVYACTTDNQISSCDFTAGGVVTGGIGSPSVALTPTGRAIFVSTVGGQRTEHCQVEFRPNGGFCPVLECTQHTRQWPPNEGLTVHSAVDGNQVFGVRTVNGNYEVLERNSYPCDTSWTVLFTLPTTAGSRPIPVRFGTTRAALYRDNNGDVRVLR